MSIPNWWGDWRPGLTPHTGNLQSTDLIECTMIVGGLPVNTVITGAQILGAVPTPSVAWGSITGTLLAQTDLSTALSGKASTGAVTGTGITMSTARILGRSTAGTGAIEEITIGTGLSLSAGTLSASGGSSGLTVGTTAIASGTIGRVLFQGTGNVLQQSANLFWDNTNSRLGIGTATPLQKVQIKVATGGTTPTLGVNPSNQSLFIGESDQWGMYFGTVSANGNGWIQAMRNNTATSYNLLLNPAGGNVAINGIGASQPLTILNASSTLPTLGVNPNGHCNLTQGGSWGLFFGLEGAQGRGYIQNMRTDSATAYAILLNPVGGNVTIGTSTDAGYKLDVNGTARVQGKLSVNTPTAASAVMEITSTTQGFLPPRMTNAQMLAIAAPAAGLVVYDTTNNKHVGYDGTAWQNFY